MSLDLLEPGEGEGSTRFTVTAAGSAEELDALARALKEAADRSGARYVIERAQVPADELGLYSGEHRL